MKITIIYLFFSFLLIIFSQAFPQSQQFLIKKYSVENGLPDNRVNDIAQDSLGRIWIAMKTGIAMYDGVQWKKFGEKDGVPEVEYLKIKIDEKGTIWFMPSFWYKNYILYLRNEKFVKLFLPQNNSNYTTQILSIDVSDNNGNAYVIIGTKSIGILEYKDSNWKQLTEKDGLLSDNISKVIIHDKKIFLSSSKGLSIINENRKVTNYDFSKYGLDPKILQMGFYKIDSDDKENLILFGINWLAEFINGRLVILNRNFILPYLDFSDINFIGKHFTGNLIFGNQNTIYSYSFDSKKISKIVIDDPSANKGASSVLIDYEGNIWFVGSRGIIKCRYVTFRNFTKQDGLLENEVSAISEFNSGKMVFGHNYGISIQEKGKFSKISFENNPAKIPKINRVLDITADKANDVIYFVSLSKGVGKINENLNLSWLKLNLGERYTSIFIDKTDSLFIGTENGLSIFILGKNYSNNIIGNKFIRKILIVDHSTIYIATTAGLFSKNKHLILNYFRSSDVEANNLYSIFYNKKYGLLVGSIKGLYTLKNNELVKFKLGNREIDESVYFIIEDKQFNLWIGTNNGVLKWDCKELKRYNKSDGLAGNETNRAAGFVDSKGNVWIGTDEGVSMYTGNELDYSLIKPKLLLLDVESGSNRKRSLSAKSSFEPSDNNLTFNYRGLSFIDETQNQYQIKLLKTDNDFNDSLFTNYTYSKFYNLPYGDYVFAVRYKNAKGIWSEWKRSSVITIKQPFYTNPFFIAAGVLIFSLFLFYIYEFINQRRYAKRLEKVVDDRTKSLKQKQSELITSLERYRGIVDSQSDLVVRFDPENRLTFVNDAFCNVFGKPREELLGKTFYPLLHPDDIDGTIEEIKKLNIPPYRVTIERRALTLNGYRWFNWEGYAIHDSNNNIIEVQGVARDITLQKEIEAELEKRVKERTTELKSLVSQSPFGILTFNEEGYLIDYNDTANSLFRNLDEHPLPNLNFNIYEDEFLIRNNYKERLNNLNSSKGLLITNRILIDNSTNEIYKNLYNRYLLYRIYTIEYENKSKNLVLLLEDVTDLQKSEEVNRKLNEEKVRISTFIKTVETERDRISKELHDGIGQMLTSAKLKLDVFRMRTNADKSEIDDALSILLNAGDEIRRIINGLRPFDIDNFGLVSAIELLCDRIRQVTGLNVQYSVTNYKNIQGKDRENLTYRIIQEALNNIVKHSNCKNVGISIYGNTNDLMIEVWDDGIGLNQNDLDKNNSGFGISNMKERVADLGGEILFITAPQKGLKIQLRIPIYKK